MVHQSWVKELGRVGLLRLVKVPPNLVLVVDGNTFHAGLACTDAGTVFVRVGESFGCFAHLVKKGYSLLNGICYFPNLKARILQLPLTVEDGLDLLTEEVRSESSDIEGGKS